MDGRLAELLPKAFDYNLRLQLANNHTELKLYTMHVMLTNQPNQSYLFFQIVS